VSGSGVREALAGRRIAVCVGSGGVGKTTVAAALALARAREGGRALVCTIDPARRLATAMGLSALGNVETEIPPEELAGLAEEAGPARRGLPGAGAPARGRLFAMMLDVKRTWDDLIARHAPDPARRDRILQNRLYQQMSAALAGSQEYMAMEKLYELATDRDYDLIVLDTPPTAHALDFLEAPDRVLDFLGNDTARTLLAPAIGAGRFGFRLAQLGSGYLAKGLARFTGQQALADLGEFLHGFQGMYDGFKARATAVRALLARPEVGFVLVTSPSPAAVDEALAFHRRLIEEGMPVAGLVVNRLTPALWTGPAPLPTPEALAGPLAAAGVLAPALAERLAAALGEHERLAAAELRGIARLLAEVPGPRSLVPRLAGEVHDLAGLARLAARL
jgi:anion-transporting  ArsA/GET3 family ATPase